MKSSKGGARRIAVDEPTYELLAAEVKRVRDLGVHYKLNESKLACWIVQTFFERYRDKDQTRLESQFFNRKSYLEKIVREADSEEELKSKLGKFLRKSKRKRVTSKPRAKQEADSGSGSELPSND